MSFDTLSTLGYTSELLPVIPPNAKISSYSRAPEALATKRGKVPGKMVSDGWVGFAKWTDVQGTPSRVAQWASWGASVGVQTRHLPSVDIDVDDEVLSERITNAVRGVLGNAPERAGARGRRLFVYRAAENDAPSKKVVSWIMPDGSRQAVEFLGAGQQFVAYGIHPKTGTAYRWVTPLPDKRALPCVTATQLDEAAEAVALLIELAGYEVLRQSSGGQGDANQEALLAPSLDAVKAALRAVPNDVEYDEWIRVCAAVKAASGESDGGYAAWVDWSLQYEGNTVDLAREKWLSIGSPYTLGWPWLSQWAALKNPTAFSAAAYDFEEIDDPETASSEKLFARYVWVSKLERAGDTWTRELLSKTQFNVRNNTLGDPSSSTKSAWALWLRDHERLVQVDGVTYRPGQGAFVAEAWGRCLNTWKPSAFVLAEGALDEDVRPWRELVEYMYPEEADTVIDWMAYVLQHPEVKPNWHLVLGSLWHGLGKDMTLRPFIRAVGENNTRIITPDQILAQYTDWAQDRKLVIVEEMQTYGRREMENRLKPYLASPPDTVPISAKYMPLYEVPNICALVFLTNHENAMPLTKQDRRYFVAWSDKKPRGEDYYKRMAKWQEDGGAAKVGRWLMSRDVTKFDARGVAPMTAAKEVMQRATLTPVENWIEEGVLYGDGPFGNDLVDLADLCRHLPDNGGWKNATPERLGSLLRRAGAIPVRRVRLPRPLASTGLARANLYALRRADMYVALDNKKLVELFLGQEKTAEFG